MTRLTAVDVGQVDERKDDPRDSGSSDNEVWSLKWWRRIGGCAVLQMGRRISQPESIGESDTRRKGAQAALNHRVRWARKRSRALMVEGVECR